MSDLTRRSSGSRVSVIAVLLVLVLAVGVLGYVGWQKARPGRGDFPAIAADLTPRQRTVLSVARAQWQDPGPGTKYSAGVSEDWCADFVSWVHRRAGYPMSNPNSGSWRIPGVLTLQSYLQDAGRFHPVGDGYRPGPGDIVIYNGGDFGQHTNLVIDMAGDRIRTVGGNQGNGIGAATVTVRESAFNARGVLGYGVP